MRTAVIYKIINLADGKAYVGSTINLKNRWKCHRSHLRAGTHHCRHLQFAWSKHGESSFGHEVLEECPVEQRTEREQFWIDTLRAADPMTGYNSCPLAMTCARRRHTDETRAKISAAHKGREKSAAHYQRISEGQRGREATPETRALLSKALKGRRPSAESIAKSLAARAGFKHSEVSKSKMSEAARGRSASPETREKLSLAGLGRKWTVEQRAKIAARERHTQTQETRTKLSQARGGRPFICTSPTGQQFRFATLYEAATLGLDASNVRKCLIGKAKQTKGYRCHYEAPKPCCEV